MTVDIAGCARCAIRAAAGTGCALVAAGCSDSAERNAGDNTGAVDGIFDGAFDGTCNGVSNGVLPDAVDSGFAGVFSGPCPSVCDGELGEIAPESGGYCLFRDGCCGNCAIGGCKRTSADGAYPPTIDGGQQRRTALKSAITAISSCNVLAITGCICTAA